MFPGLVKQIICDYLVGVVQSDKFDIKSTTYPLTEFLGPANKCASLVWCRSNTSPFYQEFLTLNLKTKEVTQCGPPASIHSIITTCPKTGDLITMTEDVLYPGTKSEYTRTVVKRTTSGGHFNDENPSGTLIELLRKSPWSYSSNLSVRNAVLQNMYQGPAYALQRCTPGLPAVLVVYHVDNNDDALYVSSGDVQHKQEMNAAEEDLPDGDCLAIRVSNDECWVAKMYKSFSDCVYVQLYAAFSDNIYRLMYETQQLSAVIGNMWFSPDSRYFFSGSYDLHRIRLIHPTTDILH